MYSFGVFPRSDLLESILKVQVYFPELPELSGVWTSSNLSFDRPVINPSALMI